MSRRIDIELTSTLDGGKFTWRAAGAKQPKGVVDASVLPSTATVGDEFKVEVDQTLDGLSVLSVVDDRQRVEKVETLELLPAETDFKPILETRAPGGRGGDRGRGRNDRGPRRDRGDGGGRRGDGQGRDGRDRDGRGRGRDGQGRDGRDGQGRDGQGRDGRGRGRDGHGRGPRREAPPELPQRPKPKRLRPGKKHRNEVLATLPEEQRPIAEVAVQGMAAVRTRLAEENTKAAAEGRPTMPEATVLKMAEDLLPRLRVAEWTDRADAAIQQLDTLDLRDLRSVVAAAADPVVARAESTAALASQLKSALASKQEQELQLWFADIDAALAVGRVIRALRLSAQPPKAGVPFPVDIAERLTVSANAALTPIESAERWVATLEAAAFSPIHTQIAPMGKPPTVTDELTATVKRLAPALPQVAAMFDIEVDPKAPFPKPLRPDYGKRRRDKAAPSSDTKNAGERKPRRDNATPGGKAASTGPRQDGRDQSGAASTDTPDNAPTTDAADGSSAASAAPEESSNAPAESADEGASNSPDVTDSADVTDNAGATDNEHATDNELKGGGDDSMPPVIDADAPVALDEAELVAEAEVVEEAEAITEEAAAETESDTAESDTAESGTAESDTADAEPNEADGD